MRKKKKKKKKEKKRKKNYIYLCMRGEEEKGNDTRSDRLTTFNIGIVKRI